MGAEPSSVIVKKEKSNGDMLLAETGMCLLILPVPAWTLGTRCIPLSELSVIRALQRL